MKQFSIICSTLSFAFFILLLVPLPWSDCIAKNTDFKGGLSREREGADDRLFTRIV